MNNEPLPYSYELTLPPELEFMSPESIEAFRGTQDAQLEAARVEAIDTEGSRTEARNAADARVKAANDENCEAYVAQHVDRSANPALFDHLKALVIATSIYNMGNAKWNRGDADSDGEYTHAETAGHAMLVTEMGRLLNHGPDTPDDEPRTMLDLVMTPELIQSHRDLKVARDNLAKLSIERRRKLHRLGRKSKEQEFLDATEAYEQANLATSVLYINELRNQGLNPEELQTRAIEDVVTELGRFTEAEKAAMTADTTRRGKIATFLGKTNLRLFGSSVVLGATTGLGVRAGSRALFGAAGGVVSGALSGAAIGAGVGVITSLATTRARLFNQLDARGNQDKTSLQKTLTEAGVADTAEATYTSFYGKLKEIIQTRERKDQSSNRKRLGAAALFGAVGGAGGALLVDGAIDHHWFGLGHHSSGHHGSGAGKGPDGDGSAGMGNGHHGGTTPTTHNKPGYTDGFKDKVYVEHGHGYTNELQDLAAQKHLNLSDHLAWHDYQQMADKFHGNLLTNDHSYVRSAGDYGISRPGFANWNPQAVHFFNHLLQEQIKAGTVTKS